MKDYTKGVRLPRHQYTEEEKKAARYQKLQQIIKYAKYMSDHKIPYTLSSCNGKYSLKSDFVTERMYERGEWLIPPILGFVNKMNGYMKKNAISARFTQQYFEKDIVYMEAPKKPAGTILYDLIEIDIDEAYWKTAYKLGVLSDELYTMEGLREKIEEYRLENKWLKEDTEKLLKRARLVALGSLAKKTVHYEFRGHQMLRAFTEHKYETENIWFTVCKRVSDLMLEIMSQLGSECIFFWVDGIYVRNTPENVSQVENIIHRYGYNSKKKPIHRIEYQERIFTVFEDEAGERKRIFNYVDRNDKRNRRIDPELLDYCLKGMKED